MKKDITELFVFIDDFIKAADDYMKHRAIIEGRISKRPTRVPIMSNSEILTIILLYQQSPCKNFKYFYQSYLPLYKEEFKKLISYERFVHLKRMVLQYLGLLVSWLCEKSKKTGISYIDSTSLEVCHSKRGRSNKVFTGLAKFSKNTKGYFYGFKLHVIINEIGQIHSLKLTRGNVDDRSPVVDLVKHLTGLLFGDKGYIKAELFKNLYQKGLKLVTGIKKNMKSFLMPNIEKRLLRKRSIIETVFDYLKNKFGIEHSRHRSFTNFLVHILATITAYCLKTNKPKIKFDNLITH